jgi:hypothetical protein
MLEGCYDHGEICIKTCLLQRFSLWPTTRDATPLADQLKRRLSESTAVSHKGMVQSDMSKPALIFFFTARIHTTKSTVNILAANTDCKYF